MFLDSPFEYVSLTFRNIRFFLKIMLFGRIERIENPPKYYNDEMDESSEKFQKFKKYYDDEILPKLEDFERQRVDTLKGLRIHFWIMVFLLVSVFFILGYVVAEYSGNPRVKVFWAIILITTALLPIYYSNKLVEKYIRKIKQELYTAVVKFFGRGFLYKKDKIREFFFTKNSAHLGNRINEKQIIDSGFDNDYVEGEYRNNKIQFVDATLKSYPVSKNPYGSIAGVGSTKIFSGFLILITREEKLSGYTVVAINKISDKYFKDLKGLSKITEHPFAGDIQIYSNDAKEASSLITDSFIENINKLAGSFGAVDASCAFYDDKLLIRIPLEKRFFDISIFKPITLIEESNRFLRVMDKIYAIIDGFSDNKEKTA
ncbi:MAG: DUF3137 domain-containing protein [Rickettsiales bacterium]